MAKSDMIMCGMIVSVKLSHIQCEVDPYLSNGGAGDTVVPGEELDCSHGLIQSKDVPPVQEVGSFLIELLASLEDGRRKRRREVVWLDDRLGNEHFCEYHASNLEW